MFRCTKCFFFQNTELQYAPFCWLLHQVSVSWNCNGPQHWWFTLPSTTHHLLFVGRWHFPGPLGYFPPNHDCRTILLPIKTLQLKYFQKKSWKETRNWCRYTLKFVRNLASRLKRLRAICKELTRESMESILRTFLHKRWCCCSWFFSFWGWDPSWVEAQRAEAQLRNVFFLNDCRFVHDRDWVVYLPSLVWMWSHPVGDCRKKIIMYVPVY